MVQPLKQFGERMKYLSQGQESNKKITLLLTLTKIKSESIKDGIYYHFVKNFSVGDSSLINDCSQPNLTTAIKKLNEVAETVEMINELKYMS